MHMPYLLDGKNLVGAMGGDPSSDADEARMCRDVLQWASRRRSTFTIVLDGPVRFGLPAGGSVTLRFSAGRSADETILTILRRSTHAADCIVVTNDRALRDTARGEGATVLKCAEFISKMRGRPAGRGFRSARGRTGQAGNRASADDKPRTWDAEADLRMFTTGESSSRK